MQSVTLRNPLRILLITAADGQRQPADPGEGDQCESGHVAANCGCDRSRVDTAYRNRPARTGSHRRSTTVCRCSRSSASETLRCRRSRRARPGTDVGSIRCAASTYRSTVCGGSPSVTAASAGGRQVGVEPVGVREAREADAGQPPCQRGGSLAASRVTSNGPIRWRPSPSTAAPTGAAASRPRDACSPVNQVNVGHQESRYSTRGAVRRRSSSNASASPRGTSAADGTGRRPGSPRPLDRPVGRRATHPEATDHRRAAEAR